MGGGLKKEYRPLGSGLVDDRGKPLTVLGAAVSAFAACLRVDLILITVPPDAETGEYAARCSLPERLLASSPIQQAPRIIFVPGGNSRRASVYHALSFLSAYQSDYVLIHDGARPWIEPALIDRIIDAVIEHGAVIPLIPLTETPKEIDDTGFVRRHLRRASLGIAQTPQAFSYPAILQAHEKARAAAIEYTDDAEIWGEFVGPVAFIPGSPQNRKITFSDDLQP
jgi:2-C-methyl-D-erythritol 4-phosphate cytidylyltransferase